MRFTSDVDKILLQVGLVRHDVPFTNMRLIDCIFVCAKWCNPLYIKLLTITY